MPLKNMGVYDMHVQMRPTLLTVSQFVDRHPWCTRGGLRQILFERHTNGFDACVLRVGRKLLLDEDRVFQWLETHGRERRKDA